LEGANSGLGGVEIEISELGSGWGKRTGSVYGCMGRPGL